MTPPPSVELQKQVSAMHIAAWKEEVFTVRWWVLLLLLLLMIIIWWRLLDKTRLSEICLYAALALFLILGVNEYGQELVGWDYPTDILAVFPPLSSINLLLLPLVTSLLYQRFSTGKYFFYAMLVTSAVFCLLIEPMLALCRLYVLLHWRYYFSIPIYLAMAMLTRLLVQIILYINNKQNLKKATPEHDDN